MKYLKRFLFMLQFFTRIPIRAELNVSSEDCGKGLVFAPEAGFLIGGILAVCWMFLKWVFPVIPSAVIIMILYILLTGGLHLDGLGDTFDGLFSNRSRERMLEIMKDSRVGSNAVIAVISVLLLDIAFLASLDGEVLTRLLVLMPAAGRAGTLIGAGVSQYARSEGLGKSFIDYCGLKEIVVGLIPYFLISGLVFGYYGLILAASGAIISWLLVRWFGRKIGGATGDILGAVCELTQTFFLMAAYLLTVNII
jgi:adenosylcobinamide-GDP ribazoletransferase